MMTNKYKNKPNFKISIPDGEDRERPVCKHCGFVDYQNPKIVVGSVAVCDEKILLCRRAIEPRTGYWTLPAGYLELGETPEEGARREAWEEARVRPTIKDLLAIYSIPRISQVQLIFRAELSEADASPGPESCAVQFVAWDDIPWPDIAFPSVGWALRHYRESLANPGAPPFSNPIEGV